MSTNYSANQYNQEFSSKRLQMYEIPKPILAKEPKKRNAEITFISNERGHLQPGVARSPSNPFGDYVGTWDLPKSIAGPYHIVEMGRSNSSVQKLHEKKKNIENAVRIARENQKPRNMSSNS